MKYLITGCAGFIGSSLTKELLKRGHLVLGVDRLDDVLYSSEIKRRRLDPLLALPNFEFLEMDICDRSLLTNMTAFAPEVLINEAGLPGQEASWKSLESYSHSNFLGAYSIAQMAVELGVRKFVQASTSSIYGLNATGNEESEKDPISPYGVTKLAAENILKAVFDKTNIDFVTVRYFSVYGPGQRPDMGIYKFINLSLMGLPVKVYGDGEQSRDFTYVLDAVDGTIAAAEYGISGQAYNLSGGAIVTVSELLSEIASVLGKDIEKIYQIGPRGDQFATSADTSKARRDLYWKPQVKLSAGIKHQVDWQKSLLDIQQLDIHSHHLPN